MGKKGSKKLRGSRGSRVGSKEIFDLMVPVPKSPGQRTASVECKLLVKEIRDRLESTGFTHMALTHTIYGRPKPEDRAEVALPASLWSTTSSTSANNSNKPKKRKLNESSVTNEAGEPKIRILRRLHVVIENQSDMGIYLSNGPQQDLLNEYDLVSICPTNDATFQSACTSATMADIITVDYTARGLKLPYRIRSSDVKAATERGATFEIPIAPALLHLKQRKALVHACQELVNSSLATKPRIVISSGDRMLDGADAGALALRYPGDLSNLCKTVMHFDAATACNAMGSAAVRAVQRGKERRFGKTGVVGGVTLIKKKDLVIPKPIASNATTEETSDEKTEQKVIESKEEPNSEMDTQDDDEHSDDGFIAM